MKPKRFLLSCLLAGSLLASLGGVAGAKEVANPRASCVGAGFSDHATRGDFRGGGLSDLAQLHKTGAPTAGSLISNFAGYHEGSHAACEPKFGQPRP